MERHPGGADHTRKLLEQSGLKPGARILDLGAGDGSSLLLMREMGYQASGLDISPRSDLVMQGDFLKEPDVREVYDGVLSQCSFFVSGDVSTAFRRCRELLKQGGMLLYSDVCFMTEEELIDLLEKSGFRIIFLEDMTEAWKTYYIQAIWDGTAECYPKVKGKCRYFSVTAERR